MREAFALGSVFCAVAARHPSLRCLVKLTVMFAGVLTVVCSCAAPDATSPNAIGAKADTAPTRLDLGTLGGLSSYAADISDGDVVVGSSQTSSGATHAFKWSVGEGMTDLGTLSGDDESQAVAILDDGSGKDGEILGFSGSADHLTPVIWTASGGSRALPIPLLPAATLGRPTGFNAAGQVIGWDLAGLQHAWVWSAVAGKHDLTSSAPGESSDGAATAISPSGTVLLTTRMNSCHAVDECWRTLLWSEATGFFAIGTPTDDPDVAITGLAMNTRGTIVGWIGRTHGGSAAYRWDPGSGFRELPHHSASSFAAGYATAVNRSGTVVGADREPSAGSYVATAWPAGGGIVRLSPDDPNPSIAVAINSSGSVAGWAALSEHVNHAVVWSAQHGASPTLALVPRSASHSVASVRTSSCLAQIRSLITRERLIRCALTAEGEPR